MLLLASLICPERTQGAESDSSAVVVLQGTDFRGGANQQFGSSYLGKKNVNYVYARPAGEQSHMQAVWNLEQLPASPQFLHLTAADDEPAAVCAVRIQFNGQTIHAGKNPFPQGGWETRQFAIPAEAFRIGENRLEIENLETAGRAGGPPWFMVAEAFIAEKDYVKPSPAIRLERSPEAAPRLVGFGKVDVTPQHPVLLSGYAARPHQLTLDVRQKLWARAMAVGSDDESPAILIAVDNTGVPAKVRQEVLKQLQSRHKIRHDRLTICSTHTHSGPMLTGALENLLLRELNAVEREAVDRYTQYLTHQLVEAALAALRDRQPSYLYLGQGTADFALNRRREPAVDPTVPVLAVADEADRVRGIVTNYACHCVSGGMGLDIHGDWAACAAEEIEKLNPDTTAIVLIGCGADQNPKERGDFSASQRQGSLLAKEVQRVLQQGVHLVEGGLKTTFSELELPLSKLPDAEQLRQQIDLKTITGHQARKNLARLESGQSLSSSLPYPVQTWQFGNALAWVFLGNEVVVDYSLSLKQQVDPARLWVTAYANDVSYYLPSDRVLKRGGYEAVSSMEWYGHPAPLSLGAESRVLDEVKRQLGDLTSWEHDSSSTAGTVPLTPDESMTRMQLPAGFRVELVACEPLVVDPVAIDFGPDGKLWVAEMRDYPEGVPGTDGPGGVIKFLEDDDGDGKYDRATTFLEGVAFPTGVTAWKNGVLISAAPDVLYAEDTDNDGRADVVQVLLSGFATHNYQARVNSLSLGLDNWIYGAAGIFGGQIGPPGEPEVDAQNRDFRFLPDRKIVQGVSGRTQQGRVRDDWGNWFGCSNSVLLQHYPITESYHARNPRAQVPNPNVYAARDHQLFPIGRIIGFALSGAPGTPTSVCGLGIYRDVALGEEYSNNTFACEPVNQLVHRRQLEARGTTFAGVRAEAEQDREFLSSTDNWFRPVQVRTGPDGAIWVVDMSSFVIEHPRFLSEDVKSRLQIRAGDNRGRIYRIVRDGMPVQPAPKLRNMKSEEVVPYLASTNGTIRDLAHLELLWRNESEVQAMLKKMAVENSLPQARLHALCVLAGLQQLEQNFLRECLQQEQHPGVQRHLIRLSEAYLSALPELIPLLARFVNSPDPQVRLQLAYSLGEARSAAVSEALVQLLLQAKQDVYLASAVHSSLNEQNAGEVLAKLRAAGAPRHVRKPVMIITAEIGDPATIYQDLLPEFELSGEAELRERFKIWKLLHPIMVRRVPAAGTEQQPLWSSIAQLAQKVLANDKTAVELRAAAVPLLTLENSPAQTVDQLSEYLLPHQSAALQKSALETLVTIPSEYSSTLLFETLQKLSPALQAFALDKILSEQRLTIELLDQLESQTIPRSLMDTTRQQLLTSHPVAGIRDRAKKLFSSSANADIAKLLATLSATNLNEGEQNKGRELFVTHCAACHQYRGVGHHVGPDLAGLTDKSKNYLLKAIFDPNAAVDRRYASYTALLTDGRVYSGILASEGENAVLLKEKGGTQRELLRIDLEELSDTGKSMMPEGLDRELTPEALKHLLAFLKATDLTGAPTP